jgi:hypothetical protein
VNCLARFSVALALALPLHMAQAQTVNMPPTAQLVLPVNGSAYSGTLASIPFLVSASDEGGSIAKVDVFEGVVLLHTFTSAPYGVTFNAPPGTYTFSARVTDNLGATTTTAIANVNVYAISPGNTAPVVAAAFPPNSATYEAPATLPILASALDSDGTINRIEHYLNGYYLGVGFSGTFSGLPAGTYAYNAVAYDNLGVFSVSARNTVTVLAPDPANVAPNVSLNLPIAGAQYLPSATIPLTAEATDAGGSINRVEFLINEIPLFVDAVAPYSASFVPNLPGVYQANAIAYDNQGKRTVSTARVFVASVPPSVSLAAAPPNSVHTAPATFTLSANAADTDGSIFKVEFFSGATKLGEDLTAPYSWPLNNLIRGSYNFTARAIDNLGVSTTSAPLPIIVNELPTAALTSPVAGIYSAVRPIQLAATATDIDGSIGKVEFFDGATLIGTVIAPPFEMAWTSIPAGAHVISAKSTDNRGGVKTSAAVNITVNAANTAPVINITAPLNNAILNLPGTVTIKANATDLEKNDGVKQVEFYAGSILLSTDTVFPYEYVWSPAAGIHALTAKAIDNTGALVTSGSINFIANNKPTISLAVPQILGGYTAPANVALNATVSDSDGSIAKVEFYSGTTLIRTATSAPYTFVHPGVAAGSHDYTAKVFDNRNAVTTSSVVNIQVSEALRPVTYTYDELGRLIRVQR